MPDFNRDELRAIKSFPQLVKYLRDELDWPIEADDFEEITFEYDPEELGIDPETAAKIQEIKQLRPLVSNQPWGIFFLKFEPKRLPVVVLRRILSKLVIKKRASAKTSERAVWNLHDLLFISNYGEGEQRQITFANFSQDENNADLPTLKVLGWDYEDTELHIDNVHHELKAKLRWPDDAKDLKKWRDTWSSAFILRNREVITTSKDLATRLAALAQRIRQRARLVLALENANGPMRQLYRAFQETLIHDLKEDDFADMYAQTIAYGLLAARMSRPMGITSSNITDMVPNTNPFLRDILNTFIATGGRQGKIDFDELGVQEIVELLNSPDTHMDAILRDFGNRTRQEDPVIHFYELFLTEYDKKKKVQRGVFYTPQPVVSYIVRSIHELLQKEFGLEDGLADVTTWGEMTKRNKEIKIPEGVSPNEPFVQILDPAVGTATFLVEVIDVVHKTMMAKWLKQGHMALEFPQLWNEYVPKHLLPRVYGYELMMAPYAIAHMRLGLKLFETGYRFGAENARANVYLTNSLEPASEVGPHRQFQQLAPALAHEAKAVNEVKWTKRFTVVIGNPPYSGVPANNGQWITGLINGVSDKDGREMIKGYKLIDGKPLDEKNPKMLHDDYVKFIRFGQWQIERTTKGVLGFITNHSYLDNLTFRGMRYSLINAFSSINILNLHGNAIRKEICPNGNKDENVFDIQQGVAIGLLFKTFEKTGVNKVRYADLWGLREEKYRVLSTTELFSTQFVKLSPSGQHYFFIPQDEILKPEFEKGWKVSDIFTSYSASIYTGRDKLTIQWSKKEVENIINDLCLLTSDVACKKYELGEETHDWKLSLAKKDIQNTKSNPKLVIPVLYRPFDIRYTYYTGHSNGFLCRPRSEVMRHMLTGNNIGLVFQRGCSSSDTMNLPQVSIFPTDQGTSYPANRALSYLAPLYLFSDDNGFSLDSRCRPNLNHEFIKAISEKIGLTFTENGKGEIRNSFGPEDILDYAYSIFHSPVYRKRYIEFLKMDFPRLPLPGSLNLFRKLSSLGNELVELHLFKSLMLSKSITKLIGNLVDCEIEIISYDDCCVWIDKSQSTGLSGITKDVWNLQVGGYQVCQKWLKDRKGRVLSAEDITHYQKIVVALSETIRLMKEIDEVIEEHGGWPGAFT